MDVRESSLSFGFSKVIKRPRLVDGSSNKLRKRDGPFSKEAMEEDVDFVTGMVGSTITGSRAKPKKAELIIPLPAKPNQPTGDSWSGLSAGPLIEFSLSGGSVGGSEKSTLEDYDRIPVADFGLAMLRGMGWKAEEGIGLKNKRVVEMREPEVRPRGLGLGAERPQSNKDVLPPSKSKEEVKVLTIKIGAYAVITRGSNKGLYGQIASYDEDNNRVIMKLAIGSQMAAVSKFYIDLVDPEEYKKKSKILNNEKYEEYKLKQENRNAQRESRI